MGIKADVRRRLAIGMAGAVLASALIVGVAPVAADDPEPFERDVNVGRDATGMASDTAILTITSVTVAPVVSNDVPAAPSDGTPITNWREDRD